MIESRYGRAKTDKTKTSITRFVLGETTLTVEIDILLSKRSLADSVPLIAREKKTSSVKEY